MKHTKYENFGKSKIIRFFRPGIHLSDNDLLELRDNITNINKGRFDYGLLNTELTFDEFKEITKDMIISLMQVNGIFQGFITCPIIKTKNSYIFHAGLIVVNRNYLKNDLISILGAGNAYFAMKHLRLKTIYTTNITNTPAICESYSKFGGKLIWPSPNAKLREPYKDYKKVLTALKDNYIDKYFPEEYELKVDNKRFVLTSKDIEMGFNTSFAKSPKADNLHYNLFCKMWLNYDLKEDLIQVGTFTLASAFKVFLHLQLCKFKWRNS